MCAGTIAAVGSAVKNVKVGQRVAIEPGVPCRRCSRCREGAYNLCEDTIFAATPPWDGTLARYYICASDYVYPIADHMTMEEGAMVEPVAVACQVLKVAELQPRQNVLVFGCGPIGLLCQAVARAYGAKKVIGVDVNEARLDFAKTFGADDVFLPERCPEGVDATEHSERIAAKLKEQCSLGEGPDVVLECTGAEPCIQMGVQAAKKGGTYVQAGMGKENVVFPITTMCIRALSVRGSIRYTSGCYERAVDLVASGKVDVKRLITQRYAFTEAEQAFELVRVGRPDCMKVVIAGP